MLVLSRKVDEKIVIGDDIVITLVRIEGKKVKIGVQAPKNAIILRKELYDEVQQGKRSDKVYRSLPNAEVDQNQSTSTSSPEPSTSKPTSSEPFRPQSGMGQSST